MRFVLHFFCTAKMIHFFVTCGKNGFCKIVVEFIYDNADKEIVLILLISWDKEVHWLCLTLASQKEPLLWDNVWLHVSQMTTEIEWTGLQKPPNQFTHQTSLQVITPFSSILTISCLR